MRKHTCTYLCTHSCNKLNACMHVRENRPTWTHSASERFISRHLPPSASLRWVDQMRQGDTHLHEYQLDTHSKNRYLTITQCGCTDPETDAPSILTQKLPVLPPQPYALYLALLHWSALTAQKPLRGYTPTHFYALNLSFSCMCSSHLLGLKHLHNTPTKSIPQPPQAVAPKPWAQKTPPNCAANVITHTHMHAQAEM